MNADDLQDLLASISPQEAYQCIIGIFADWAAARSRSLKGGPSKTEYATMFLKLLGENIDELVGSPLRSVRPERLFSSQVSHQARILQARQGTANHMATMSDAEALSFLANAVTQWSVAIPKDQIDKLGIVPPNGQDDAIAEAVFEWFQRYFDMWNE